MPNHFRGIIFIVNGKKETTHQQDMTRHVPTPQREFSKPVAGSLSTIIGAFKSSATKRINRLRGVEGVSIWQSRFYDTVIHNEKMLNTKREYIHNNPFRWASDEYFESQ